MAKPVFNVALNEKKQSISSKVRNKTKVPTLSTLIHYSAWLLSWRNKEKEIKWIRKEWKKTNYLYLKMILYLKDLKDSTPKL
jgi:hypothetical protein